MKNFTTLGLLCLLLALAWLFPGCQLTQDQKTRYTLSFSSQYSVLSKFDSVEIILKFKNGQAPVRIFHSKVKTRSEIDKLESPSYDGKFVTILISGYNAKKLVYQVEKQYNGAKGETDSTIQIVGADTGALILSAPTLSALNPGDTKMTLFWNLVSGAITYNLYYGEGGAVSKSSPKFTGTLSPFSLTGLKNDIVYAFALTSVDANGETELGSSLMAIPRLPPPGAPTLGAVTSGDKQVTVIWTDQIVATSYILYYKAGTAVDKTSSNKVSIVSPYVLSGLTNGTIYAFALSAITPTGETELSNIMTTTPHLPD